jgi:hypothetical protein
MLRLERIKYNPYNKLPGGKMIMSLNFLIKGSTQKMAIAVRSTKVISNPLEVPL